MKTNALSFIDSILLWYLFLSESKSSLITSSASSLIMISMLLLFQCITLSSLLFMEEIKLFAIVNWIFQVSDYLRLFMMRFKYDIILSRFLQLIVSYFYHFYFLIQYNCFSKNYLLLLVYNISFVFFTLKKILDISRYSLISLGNL